MSECRWIKVFPSFLVQMPSDVCETLEGDLATYWLDGAMAILQFTSFTRSTEDAGKAYSAKKRLSDLLAKQGVNAPASLKLELPGCPDTAAAVDSEIFETTYLFAVWPEQTILATVIRPNNEPTDGAWAFQAIRSLTRAADMNDVT